MTFDELALANPHLGFVVSLFEPGKTTLEVIDGEETFKFTAPTLQEAVDMAFPQPAVPPPTMVLDADDFFGVTTHGVFD